MRRVLTFFIGILIVMQGICQEYDAEALPREQRMEWWKEARFGMFIHWGLYALPAGMWKGREIEELGEWIMAYADIPVREYENLAPQFNPLDFDPDEWVKLAKRAGMRYLVLTTRHHDGFCLFDTDHTSWNVVDATPYGRDIVKELSEACKREGITFCAYYSILEWYHPAMALNTDFEDLDPFSDQALEGGPLTHIDSTWRKYGNVKVRDGQKEAFIAYMKAQLRELVMKYEPGVIWFDGGWVDWWTPEDGKELLSYLWSLDPRLVVNNRAAEDFDTDAWYGDFGTPEQHIPLEGLDYEWESCMTMNSTWGYKSRDQNWKSVRLLISQMVDIASKGGNFLLNVGPMASGAFPDQSIKSLQEIAQWMEVNRESVLGTSKWKVYREGKHELTEELYDSPDVRSLEWPFNQNDLRFTQKGNHLYVHCLSWPDKELKIKSMGQVKNPEMKISSVSMLGSAEEVKWEHKRRSLVLSVPEQQPCEHVSVYKLSLE